MSSRLLVSAFCLIAVLTATSAGAEPPKPMDGPLGMKFVPLPKGTFYMGWDGKPGSAKKTEIKEDFKIAIHTVTQGQWQDVMGKNPSYFSRDGEGKDAVKDIKDEELKQFPVENVNWNDAQAFIKKLNEKEKGKGLTYRLPSEAEWEYACRGGATTQVECSFHFYFEKPTNDLSSREANFYGKNPDGKAEPGPFLRRTTKVGSYKPNKLGLYDMHGNVLQWCEDLYDPMSSSRVQRGGGWASSGEPCRSAKRFKDAPDFRSAAYGFRLAAVPEAALAANPALAQPPKAMDGPLGMKFVPLPKGTTYLGWNGEKGSAKKTEIKADFEIAVHTVTQGQWQDVMGKNPSDFSRDGGGKDAVKHIKDEELKQFPVERVSWEYCQEFVKKLNAREKGKGYEYRLPTEAEWEYACRGGATSEADGSYHFYFAKPTNDLSSKEANFNGNFPFGKGGKGANLERPTRVGSYAPNKLGLYDMHGNVFQWTSTDEELGYRVIRGGSWLHRGEDCWAAHSVSWDKEDQSNGLGLRLVRVPSAPVGK